jgi:hypothetical protein
VFSKQKYYKTIISKCLGPKSFGRPMLQPSPCTKVADYLVCYGSKMVLQPQVEVGRAMLQPSPMNWSPAIWLDRLVNGTKCFQFKKMLGLAIF